MNRVSPSGSVLWVQTQGTNENYVLDADTLRIVRADPVGEDPEQSAFQPNGPYGLIAHLHATFLQVLNAATGEPVTRIEVGASQGNVSFTPDGAAAFVTSNGGDDVLVVDMARLAIEARIPTSAAPLGLVLLDLMAGQFEAPYVP